MRPTMAQYSPRFLNALRHAVSRDADDRTPQECMSIVGPAGSSGNTATQRTEIGPPSPQDSAVLILGNARDCLHEERAGNCGDK
jgi:hypothetical protein